MNNRIFVSKLANKVNSNGSPTIKRIHLRNNKNGTGDNNVTISAPNNDNAHAVKDYSSCGYLFQMINHLLLCQKISIYDIPFEYRMAFPVFYITANRVSRYDNNQDRCQFIDFCFRDFERVNSDENRHFSCFIESLMDFNMEVIDKNNVKKPNRMPFQ